jgi:hypothetical protein
VPLWIGLSGVLATLGLVNIPSQILPIDGNLPAVIPRAIQPIGRSRGARPAERPPGTRHTSPWNSLAAQLVSQRIS